MSAETDSSTKAVVYVSLLDEGTVVWRPVEAERVSPSTYKLLEPTDYDPDDEHWEFLPGSVVVCEHQTRDGERLLVAVAVAD